MSPMERECIADPEPHKAGRLSSPLPEGAILGCRVRKYDSERSQDTKDIRRICANVYGGTDYLPHQLARFASSPQIEVVVVEEQEGETLQAVVCLEKRGPVVWLFALRVAETARGKGIASALTSWCGRHVQRQYPECETFMSSTIFANTPMIRIFEKEGFEQTAVCKIWPAWRVTEAYEAAQDGCRTSTAAGDLRSFMNPACAKELASTEVAELAQGWRSVDDIGALSTALRAALDHREEEELPAHKAWLPWVFDVNPITAGEVGEALEDRRVWVLESSLHAAVMMVGRSSEMRGRKCIGVTASSPLALRAAAAKAFQLHPRFVMLAHTLYDSPESDSEFWALGQPEGESYDGDLGPPEFVVLRRDI